MSLRKIRYLINTFLVLNNAWYKDFFQNCLKFWKRFDFDLDVVNLGSNSAFYGFDYKELPIKGANWAMQPQSFPQDLAILKNYFSYLGHRAIILIALCPYSSCYKSYTDSELIKYYTVLHPGVIENFNQNEQERAYCLKEHPWKYAFMPMLKGLFVSVKIHLKTVLYGDITEKQRMNDLQLEADAKKWIEGWKNQFGIDDMNAFELPIHLKEGRKMRVKVLKEMLEFCKEHDFRPYIVLPPMTKWLSEKFSPVFRKNYIYSFLEECGVEKKQFLNYLDDSELSDKNLYFNSFFLNKKGAKMFTHRVLADLGAGV